MSSSVQHQEHRRLRARQKAAKGRIKRNGPWWRSLTHNLPGPPRSVFQQEVNRMTNRQRTAWARAKYPGLRHREIEPLWAFVPPERVA